MNQEIILEINDVSKSFPGVNAVNHVNMVIHSHEIVGLVGENGAGKSTLLKILVGLYSPDSGEILLRGKVVKFRNVSDALKNGIGMVFQEQSLIPNITVAENIFLGNEANAIKLGIYNWRQLERNAETQLKKLNAPISPTEITEKLSFAQRQMVEMARVLSTEERTQYEPIILLDEPTSVLEGEEVEKILEQIRRVKDHASVIFISHRLEEVLRVSDRVYVMTNGYCVAESDPQKTDILELERLMLGSDLSKEYGKNDVASGEINDRVILAVKNLTHSGLFHDVSFELHAGEILGIAGVVGSGRESLCRTLFGAEEYNKGSIFLDGVSIILRSPADAVQKGIGFIPSERRAEGIIGGMNVKDNITSAHIETIMSGPILNFRKESKIVSNWITRLKIKTPSPNTLINTLSGGNQQKVVLAKWLIAEQPKVMILDHPMRGLDVGAKAEVFDLIRSLSKNGIGILLIADTLEELIALSHNIIVMRDGVITGRFKASPESKPSKIEILEGMI